MLFYFKYSQNSVLLVIDSLVATWFYDMESIAQKRTKREKYADSTENSLIRSNPGNDHSSD